MILIITLVIDITKNEEGKSFHLSIVGNDNKCNCVDMIIGSI